MLKKSSLFASLGAVALLLAGVMVSHAQSGPLEDLANFPRTTLEILHGKSKKDSRHYDVWIANNPAREEQGLMFVRDLPASQGMLFPQAKPRKMSMWMKNTYIEARYCVHRGKGRDRQDHRACEAARSHDTQLGQAGVGGVGAQGWRGGAAGVEGRRPRYVDGAGAPERVGPEIAGCVGRRPNSRSCGSEAPRRGGAWLGALARGAGTRRRPLGSIGLEAAPRAAIPYFFMLCMFDRSCGVDKKSLFAGGTLPTYTY